MSVDVDELEANLRQAVTRNDLDEARDLLGTLGTSEVIRILDRLDARRLAVAFRLLPPERRTVVFEAFDPAQQADILRAAPDHEVARLVEDLEPDDRVRLLDSVPEGATERWFARLSEKERELTSVVSVHEPRTIGRRMTPEYVETFWGSTAGETLDGVRRSLHDAETIYTIPVLDNESRVVGIVGLRAVLAAERDTPVADLMVHADTVPAGLNEEEAARRCATLGHFAMPVVDEHGRLVGIFTLDDAVEILEEADSEDSARQGGSEPLDRPYLSTPILSLVRSRIVWLLVLAIGGTLTVQVLEVFEDTLAQMTVLSLFVPLLIGVGGNTGNQAATTVTRALALGDVRARDLLSVLGRELRVGFALGAVLGLIGFAVASLVYAPSIGLVIGLTMLASCTLAASVGGIMPIIARAIGVDPAVFSNPFISTFVDASGLIIYFLIAKAVLGL